MEKAIKNAKHKMLAIRDERDSSRASSFFTSLVHKELYTHPRGDHKPCQYKEALALLGIEGIKWTHLADQEKQLYKKAWVKAQSTNALLSFDYGKKDGKARETETDGQKGHGSWRPYDFAPLRSEKREHQALRATTKNQQQGTWENQADNKEGEP